MGSEFDVEALKVALRDVLTTYEAVREVLVIDNTLSDRSHLTDGARFDAAMRAARVVMDFLDA